MKKIFKTLAGNKKSQDSDIDKRPLNLEELENRILYSAAPVDAGEPVEGQNEEYSVHVESADYSTTAEEDSSPPQESSGGIAMTPLETTESYHFTPAGGTADGVEFNDEALQQMVLVAEGLWRDWGLTAEQESALGAIQYQIGDLGDGNLGSLENNIVTIDSDAGGFGWFIDPTPLENEEFGLDENGVLKGSMARSAYGVDLLTVLLHEQGHVIGLAHGSSGLMEDSLGVGNRKLPSGESAGAVPETSSEAHLLTLDAGVILEASDSAAVDLFGYSSSISGDTAIVGARFDDDGGTNTGSAYIYQKIGGSWTEVAKLNASDAASSDQFGFSVSIEGDYAVVGALFGNTGSVESGAAYVFHRDAGGADNWGQVAKLTAADAAAADNFGFTVAISGETVVIGAYQDDDIPSSSGSAYVFEKDQGGVDNWGQVTKLTASDAAAGDNFGYAVDISGDTVVVGSRLDDDLGVSSGSAYLFERDLGGANQWGQSAKLTASDGFTGDNFGVSVAIDGGVVAVGARVDDDAGSASGSVYVYQVNGGVWSETAKLTASDAAAGDQFGASVDVYGDEIVVGAVYNDDAGTSSGSAYVFSKDHGGANNWGEAKKLTASDAGAGDTFGQSVGIGSEGVIVGAYQNDNAGTNSGSAYIYSPVSAQTNVGIDGNGDLLIEGVGLANNNLTIVIEGSNVRISDASATLIAGNGAVEDNGDILVSLASITGAAGIVVNGGDGTDSLTVDFSGGDFSKAISYDGGLQTSNPGDNLILVGGAFSSAVYTFNDSSSGSILLSGNELITYTGLEPITSNISVDDVTLNFEGGSETITVSAAGPGQTMVDSTAGESLVMLNPTNSLNLNAGDGNDFIDIEGLGSGFSADLNIDGQTGNDQIDFQTVTTNTGGGDVTATAEDIDVLALLDAAGGDITLTASGLVGPALSVFNDLATSGSGNIHLSGVSDDSYGVSISGSSTDLSVENGSIHIVGNSDVDEGVLLNANIVATGAGGISVQGTGGNVDNSIGVVAATFANLQTAAGNIDIVGSSGDIGVLVSGGQISAGGAGNLHITGTSIGNFNGADGVQINGNSASVSTENGNIVISGESTASSSSGNEGIQLSSVIESTGSGSITLNGTGAGLTGDGVGIFGAGEVRANGGNIAIVGESINDDGVFVANKVSNTNSGNILIQGTGGPLTTDEGVVISGGGALVSSADGDISIVGSSDTGEAIVVFQGTVESTGQGDVSLTGVTQGSDIGVAIRAADLKAVDGNIELTGVGGVGGVHLISGTATTTGTGAITISGNGVTGPGVSFSNPFAEVITNGGAVSVDGNTLSLGGTIDAGSGVVFAAATDSVSVSGAVSGGAVTIVADSDHDEDGFGGSLTIVDGATISAGSGSVNLSADENIGLTGISTSGIVTVETTSGVIFDSGNTNVDVAGGRLVAIGSHGVGTSSNALDTTVTHFEASGGDGGVFLGNTGDLIVGGISATSGIQNENAAVELNVAGKLTVVETVDAGGGDINLTGSGLGGTGTGVAVQATVRTEVDGNITIHGTGGSGDFDRGIQITNSSAHILTEDGDISMVGTSTNDDGVYIAGEVASSGGGAVSVVGQGGSLTGDFGVIVSGASGRVATHNGALSISGNSSGDEGLLIIGGSSIASTGAGSILITGEGAGLGSGTRHGVVIASNGTAVETVSGDIEIQGDSSADIGVLLSGGILVNAGGSGNVVVNGHSDGSDGVQIVGATTFISSENGDVAITGSSTTANGAGGEGIQSSGIVETTGTGNVTLSGTAQGVNSDGILLFSTGEVRAASGDIEIGGTSTNDTGVTLQGLVSASGSGNVTVNGSGGVNSGDYGVSATGTSSQIHSVDGNITINGNSVGDEGVLIAGGADVIASGTGSIAIEGVATGLDAGSRYGVFVASSGTNIQASGGDISISGESATDTGTLITSGAVVENSNGGNIDITGQGGTRSNADGVSIESSTTLISTTDGYINITGTSTGDEGVQSAGRVVSTSGDITIEGSGTSINGHGVAILGSGAEVSSVDGNVSLIGDSQLEDGIRLDSGATVSTSGSGNVVLDGSSSGTDTGDSGVVLFEGAVSAVDGDVTISGTGEYTGVALASNSQADVSGSGKLTIDGAGGLGRGVHLAPNVSASTADGDLLIQGTASGLDGVDLEGSQIVTTGTGSADISGSSLLMSQMATIYSGGNVAVDVNGDASLATIVSIGDVSVRSASGVIRDHDNPVDVSGANVTFSGIVAPGITQGILNVSGDFNFEDGSLFNLDLDGVLPGEGAGNHDQLSVAGGITISSNVGLVLTQSTTFALGETITILENDGSDPVNGAFSGLPEGSFIASTGDGVASQLFRISYTGGDGNDVVLTALSLPDTSVSLVGDALVIRDELNNDTDDTYTITVESGVLVIKDPNQVLGNQVAGGIQTSQTEVRIPLTLFTRLKIESLGGDDVIDIRNLPGFTGGIDIDTGDGFDEIYYNATLTLSDGENVTFRSENIELDSGSEINANGSGEVSMLAEMSIDGDNVSITSHEGDITLEANAAGLASGDSGVSLEHGSAVSSSGSGAITITGIGGGSQNDNTGVELSHGTIISVANGNIVLTGIGGDGKNNNIGILVDHGSALHATGDGSITLQGTGGGNQNDNVGIELNHGTVISVANGNISLTGVGSEGKNDNIGVLVDHGSRLEVTGTGDVSLDGTGGGNQNNNRGIELNHGTIINVANGNISLTGIAGDGKNDNAGISIDHGSNVQVAGAGDITLTGTGRGNQNDNIGIDLNHGTGISAANGDLTLTGVGGDGKNDNTGISIDHGSSLQAGGDGDVTLTGTGGGDQNDNKGIDLNHGVGISVVNGDISLTGTGGGGKNDNIGISIDHGTSLQATGTGGISFGGYGGNGKQSNSGVYIAHGSAINTVYGVIDILGVGGDATGSYNFGIEISGSSIGSVFGDVNLVAFGGDGNKFNHGLVISGSNIFSDYGLVSMMGTAGGGSNSDDIVL